jgi:hypothetical protein
MVAITVILAAVIGTFVLGLGENVQTTSTAGISTSQEANQSLTFTIVDPGNVDAGLIVSPTGNRSAQGSTDSVLQAGAQVEIDRGGWDADEIDFANYSSGGVNLVGSEECRIRHGAEVVSGIRVNGGDIGCSGQRLDEERPPSGAIPADAIEDEEEARSLDLGDQINYQTGEYKIIGIIDGNQQTIQSVVAEGN